MTQQNFLVGRITGLRIFRVPEFGTRASFTLEWWQASVICRIEGNVAREFFTYCREGDIVEVTGTSEPRPSTASSETPWTGRFRIRTVRVLETLSHAA